MNVSTPARDGALSWFLVIAAIWSLAFWAGPSLTGVMGLSLNAHGHAHLYAHGHPFVDARTLWGIPNASDVLSNLPIALAGLLGWGLTWRRGMGETTRRTAQVFFGGLVLTGIGSAVYHWAPDAIGLVGDRLGMAVTFAGALGLAVSERLGQREAVPVMVVTLLLATVSAVLPMAQGNVLPWAVVQYGGVVLIFRVAARPPVAGAIGVSVGALIAWYVAAKVLEIGDATVFHFTGEWVSGHSLKHLAAGMAAWPVIRAVAQQPLRQNPAGSDVAHLQ